MAARKARPVIVNRVIGGDTLPWEELRGWEFNTLKEADRSVTSMVAAILAEGICFPLFVWEPGKYVCDGAGRRIAFDEIVKTHDLPPIPIVKIEADDRQAAQKLALMASSHHGQVTQDGVMSFVSGMDLTAESLDSLALHIHFDGINLDLIKAGYGASDGYGTPMDQTSRDGKEFSADKRVTCPGCGLAFQPQKAP